MGRESSGSGGDLVTWGRIPYRGIKRALCGAGSREPRHRPTDKSWGTKPRGRRHRSGFPSGLGSQTALWHPAHGGGRPTAAVPPSPGAALTPLRFSPALKKSFEAEDAGDAPGSPIASPLPVGATESHRALQPSPAPHSPLLRGQHRAGRAPGGIASFQSHAGPGSDGESLRSSSSSLESPAAPQLPAASLAADPCLKKVPSHGCVFPVEAECSLHVAAGHSSLPALDLHIAEEPGIPPPAPRPTPPWGACSPTAPPHTRLPSSSSSAEVAPGLPRTQLRVSLSASPRLARPTPPTATAATGPGEGLLPPAAPFKLVSQPQTVQVSSQPAFLGGMVLGPGTPLALRNMGSTGPTMGTCLVTPRGLSQAADGCCATATPEHGRTRSSPLSLLWV